MAEVRRDCVLLQFFLLFAGVYTLGVAVLFLNAEFCRQQNTKVTIQDNVTQSRPIPSSVTKIQRLLSGNYSNKRGRKSLINHYVPIQSNIGQGIGFYFRHFIFDSKVIGNKGILVVYHGNLTDSFDQNI